MHLLSRNNPPPPGYRIKVIYHREIHVLHKIKFIIRTAVHPRTAPPWLSPPPSPGGHNYSPLKALTDDDAIPCHLPPQQCHTLKPTRSSVHRSAARQRRQGPQAAYPSPAPAEPCLDPLAELQEGGRGGESRRGRGFRDQSPGVRLQGVSFGQMLAA